MIVGPGSPPRCKPVPSACVACRGCFCGTLSRKRHHDIDFEDDRSFRCDAVCVCVLVLTAPAAKADDFCITNGAQAAHGCGYPTMEACRQAAGGIGGMCSQSGGSKTSNDALAFQPKQTQSRGKLRPGAQTNSN